MGSTKFGIAICVLLILIIFLFGSRVETTSGRADGWVTVDVLSFDGDNILFRLEVSVVGNHSEEQMWLRIEPASGQGVIVEVWRGVSNVVFNEGSDLTVFTYSYSYNHTYYQAEPKVYGYLLFPWDEHKLTLFIRMSFNAVLDTHPSVCELPSQNYEGRFQVTPQSADECTLALEIRHTPSFAMAVGFMLYPTIISLYLLSFTMVVFVILVALFKKPVSSLPNLIRVSSAIMFFVPAFEIAFNNLKSPLPLVLSDILVIPVIPINASIIAVSLVLHWLHSNEKASESRV